MTPDFVYFDVPADLRGDERVYTVRDAIECYGEDQDRDLWMPEHASLDPVGWFIEEYVPSYIHFLTDVYKEDGMVYPISTEQLQACARLCAERGLLRTKD